MNCEARTQHTVIKTYSGIEPITNACNCLLSKEYQLNSYRCAEQAV